MARAIWTGALAFGLVNVPVGLYSATEDKTVHFNQFEAGTSDRIRYKRVNERTGREVEYQKIVKGYEVDKGSFVLITDEELEAAEPGASRTIDVTDFVDLDEIDPIYFQKTYYLAPVGDGADRAYTLLRTAMADTNKVGIATFVMRGKQYLVAVRAEEDVLVLDTMFFADEIRDPRSLIDDLPDGHEVGARELAVAKQLIESMATTWQPWKYRDTYRERVEDLIERKRQGEQIVAEAAPPRETNVVDLMEALRRSVDNARDRRPAAASAADAGQTPENERAAQESAGNERAGPAGNEPAAKATARASGGGLAGADLSKLTRRELAELAGELDIAGRSKMARDDLETAVRAAQERQKAAS